MSMEEEAPGDLELTSISEMEETSDLRPLLTRQVPLLWKKTQPHAKSHSTMTPWRFQTRKSPPLRHRHHQTQKRAPMMTPQVLSSQKKAEKRKWLKREGSPRLK